jgi:hypothetical protein
MDLNGGKNPVLWTRRSNGLTWAGAVLGGSLTVAFAAIAMVSYGSGALARSPGTLAEVTKSPPSASVLSGPADVVAAAAAARLFASAPVVVLASPGRRADMSVAARQARRAHAPLLVAAVAGRARASGGQSSATSAAALLREAVRALRARDILDVGVTPGQLSAQVPGVRIVTDPADAPATRTSRPLSDVVLLVRLGDTSLGAEAAAATARDAGARIISVRGSDPRADPAAIAALAAARPRQVLAIGAGFGPPATLAARVAAAATGVQLPGGGQVLFPMHRLLALYGYPGNPALGALGQQGLTASIARIRRIVAAYRPLSRVPVVPAFEIIATVAQSSPGPGRTYSYESTVASLRPWVSRAVAAGMYVVLDLQPGRASLLDQAKRYQQLLAMPDVGLALDPEWKLQPRQLPLHQIGSVSTTAINQVIGWLAGLTARDHLPQKLLVLHQFRLSMITDEQALDTSHDDLAIVIHMDGQGTPSEKLNTWQAVVGTAPGGVFFGWKNFYTKDHPTLSPRQTMANAPQPVMISYQ